METAFSNTENSKTNEPHKFVLNLTQGLELMLLLKTYLFITPRNI